jgi:hypothetical protein
LKRSRFTKEQIIGSLNLNQIAPSAQDVAATFAKGSMLPPPPFAPRGCSQRAMVGARGNATTGCEAFPRSRNQHGAWAQTPHTGFKIWIFDH